MKKYLLLGTALFSFLAGSSVVNAATEVKEDTTNYSIRTEYEKNGITAYMYLDGMEESSQNYLYYVYFFNDEASKPTITADLCSSNISYSGASSRDMSKPFFANSTSKQVDVSRDWYILKGYTKAMVLKKGVSKDDNNCYTSKILDVTRPDVTKNDFMYSVAGFTDKETSSFANKFNLFKQYPSVDSVLNAKVGIVNDNEVFKALKNGNGYGKLQEYAKSDAGLKKYVLDKVTNVPLDLNLTEGSYYYVDIQTDYDDKYIDLNRTYIIQVKNNRLLLFNEWDVLYPGEANNDVVVIPTENTIEETVPEKTPEPVVDKGVENPNTAIKDMLMIVPMITLLIVGVIAFKNTKSLFTRI